MALDDSRANSHPAGLLCGDDHLAVPLDAEKKFRKALEKLGYPFPAGPEL